MTWGEFKKEAEESGVKDDEEIWYIDVHMPTKSELQIVQDPKDGVAITS